MPAEEAREIERTFNWSDTSVVTETAPDGSPAIHYVLLRVDSTEAAEALDAARLPWSVQPFFESERAALEALPAEAIRGPVIATGQHAEALTVFNGNGFVLGLGGRNPAERLASDILDTYLLGLTGGLASLALPFRVAMNVDIVWPPGNPSRLVFAHEFGHHVFYQFMVNATPPFNPALYGQHLNTIFVGTIAMAGVPGSPFFEPMLINEGMADIMAEQLGGGATDSQTWPAPTQEMGWGLLPRSGSMRSIAIRQSCRAASK